ncbi:MAG: hypothetical protein ACE5GJ_12195 [Gemmatimonadota bacterium]
MKTYDGGVRALDLEVDEGRSSDSTPYGWWPRTLRSLFDGSWWEPYLLAVTLTVVGGIFVAPVSGWVLSGAGATAPTSLKALIWVAVAAAPLTVAARALGVAVVMWAFLVLLGEAPKGKKLFAVALAGEVVIALAGLAVGVLLFLRGPGAVSSPADLHITMGLDALAPAGSLLQKVLMQSGSVFHLGWIAVLALGLIYGAGVARSKAWITSALLWMVLLAVTVVRITYVGA